MKFILGLIIIAAGVFFVWKTETMLRTFGRIGWAEEHMQIQGGSRMWYKLIGILAIIIGLLMVTGLAGGAAEAILRPLFGLQ